MINRVKEISIFQCRSYILGNECSQLSMSGLSFNAHSPLSVSKTSKQTILFFIMFSCLFANKYCPASNATNPDIIAINPTVKLGSIPEGKEVESILKIKNNSKNAYRILDVQVSCSCTKLSNDDGIIYPHEVYSVPVKVSTKNKSGEFTVYAFIEIDNGDSLKYELNGSIKSICPNEIDFGPLSLGEKVEKSIELNISPNSKWANIDKIVYDTQIFTVQMHNSAVPTIKINIENSAKYTGAFSENIYIHTNDRYMPVKPVLIKGHILRHIELDKERVFLGSIMPGSSLKASVNMYSPYNEEINILDIKSSNPGRLSAASSRIDKSNIQINLSLEVRPNETDHFISEKLTVAVATDDSSSETMAILVLALNEYKTPN